MYFDNLLKRLLCSILRIYVTSFNGFNSRNILTITLLLNDNNSFKASNCGR